MELIAHGKSSVGQVRSSNEDRHVVDIAQGLFAVSDGMGGHQAGEIASSLAIQTLTESWVERKESFAGLTGPELSEALMAAAEAAMLEVCEAVYAEATAQTSHAGMGATLTFVAIEQDLAVMGHVGDTRLYLIREGEAHQLSTDHTLAAEMVVSGIMDAETAKKSSHAGVLTRSLGSQRAVQVDRLVFEVEPGDDLVLCSDGLTRYLPTTAVLTEQAAGASASELAERLVDHANASGGVDNATVVVVQIPAEHERSASDVRVRLGALTKVPFLSDLGLPHRSRLAQAARLEKLDVGEDLVAEGEAWSCLVVVHTGSLAVKRGGVQKGALAAESYAGVRQVVTPSAAVYSLEATEKTEVVLLEHEDFLRELHVRTWLGAHVLEQLAAELATAATPDDAAAGNRPALLP